MVPCFSLRQTASKLAFIGDTYLHSWEMLAKIIQHDNCQDILLDIGMLVHTFLSAGITWGTILTIGAKACGPQERPIQLSGNCTQQEDSTHSPQDLPCQRWKLS